ncbi:hypothetical protein KHU50_000306 [Colletotrichum sp. SAR 10_65]|nr:hypothetical protein KHU50_000306 [Colletotrichum sp. SAR 10_65]
MGNYDYEPLASLDLPMSDIVIGEESTFRTENESREDWERRRVIERTQGNIHTYVDLLEVRHGKYDNEDDGDEATMLVFRFRFDPQKASRRIARARVSVEFFASEGSGSVPIVEAIAPEELWTIIPTTDEESTTRGGELNLGVSSLVEAGATAKLEKTVTMQVHDATTISGSANLGRGKNSGESTVAVWNLHENKRRKNGVPDSARVVVLLRREDNEPFNAVVTLEADVDLVSGLE